MVDDGSSDNTISIANKFKLQKNLDLKLLNFHTKVLPRGREILVLKYQKESIYFS